MLLMSKQRLPLAGIAAIALIAAQPAIAQQKIAASYACKVTADGKVIVTVNNPNAFQILCSVSCQFKIPGGSTGMSCSKSVPASATDFELCVKSTGGAKYTVSESDIQCLK
jgi:hypothetical protein